MTLVALLVDDLMDRSRISGAIEADDSLTTAEVDEADVVVVDLARHADRLAELRARVPDAVVVAFGRHDDTAALEAARDAGADRVLTRARFFADLPAAIRP